MPVSPYIIADLVMNTITMALYLTLAFTWFQGYLQTDRSGKLILGAISTFWFMAGVHSLTYHVFGAITIISEGDTGGAYAPNLTSNIVTLMVLLAVMYILYATIKRNPPKQLEKDIEKRG